MAQVWFNYRMENKGKEDLTEMVHMCYNVGVDKRMELAERLGVMEYRIPLSETELRFIEKRGRALGYETYQILNTIHWFASEGYLRCGYPRKVELDFTLDRDKNIEGGRDMAKAKKSTGTSIPAAVKGEGRKVKALTKQEALKEAGGRKVTVKAHDETLGDGRVIHHDEYSYYAKAKEPKVDAKKSKKAEQAVLLEVTDVK